MKSFLQSLSGLALAAGAYIGAKALVTVVFAAGPTPAELIDRHFAQEPVRSVHRAMFTYFPAEAMALRNMVVELAGSGRVTDATLIAIAEAGREIRAPLAQHLAGAPDAEIVGLLDDQIRLYQSFADDPATCAQVIAGGLQSLPEGDARRTPAFLSHMMLDLFGTMSVHRFARPRIAAPTDGDFLAWDAAMAEAGIAGAFDLVIANDPADPQLCGAFLGMLTVLRDGDFVGADRLRLDTMIALATG